ncbi:putative L-carnitine dehydratase/bile acid-inducible protein F [uncultured Sphingopyxis sp.]|uniref:Putative L-carnitine dehydratase/bile acid-inducible protein F n=1 Tax=uncultured Sphingopyxis sp. TaxID=310581 RepID=A0A1Y5PS82_9SPHN|nr:CoA transferase [uncultured Sphingopyxis sp.]SBV32863.1 putative L-carnitine dehydratase/bile acid-inducible protein F [uncultured Sphingopyxis sp.]
MKLYTRAEAGPLAGIAVLEMSDDVAARYSARALSVLGAQIWRIGSAAPRQADAVDLWLDQGKSFIGTFEEGLGRLAEFRPSHRVVLVGQSPTAVETVDRLLAEHSFDALRLGITWFGHDGPYRDWQGDDALVQALIGIAASFGPSDGPPMLPQGFAPQITAGATLVVGALAGLWSRKRGGETRRVDVNIFEAAMCFTEPSPPLAEAGAASPGRTGINRFATNHPTTVYPTRDGWIGVTALTPAQWAALADMVGHPDWANDPRFATSLARVENAEALDAALAAILPRETTDHWLMEGQRRRVPLAPVPDHRELLATPHWRERGSFAPLPDAEGVIAPLLPFRIFTDGQSLAEQPPESPPAAPLDGVCVADFSMGWAGPMCTRLLADLGADIIKVESDTHYDWWRGWEPPGASDPPKYEMMPAFLVMNRNKRGICLDLTDKRGRTLAETLVRRSDIVIENYAPGVMKKLGLDPGHLLDLRSGLVMVSMGAFGASGPWSFFRAYGSTVEHASGMPHVNGEAHWPPVLQHTALGDPVAGIYGAIAALAGLHGRAELGGTWFDLGQVECLFQLGADAIIRTQTEGAPQRLGSRSALHAPRCVVAASDGYVATVVRDSAQWTALARWLGKPEWATAWTSIADRNLHGDAIEAALHASVKSMTAAEAADALQASGVPAAPINRAEDLPVERHLGQTGAWTRIERRYVGSHWTSAPVIRIDGPRPPISRPAPTLGEHGDEIMAMLVGPPA